MLAVDLIRHLVNARAERFFSAIAAFVRAYRARLSKLDFNGGAAVAVSGEKSAGPADSTEEPAGCLHDLAHEPAWFLADDFRRAAKPTSTHQEGRHAVPLRWLHKRAGSARPADGTEQPRQTASERRDRIDNGHSSVPCSSNRASSILRLIACVVLGLLHVIPAQAAITFFGIGINPADGGALDDTAARGATPPVSMVSGQLVLAAIYVRNGTEDISQVDAGGQTWSDLTEQSSGSMTVRVYCAIFDGTWDSTPTWRSAGQFGASMTVALLVYSPSAGGTLSCTPDVALAYSFGSSATTHTITGQTPTSMASVVTIAAWGSPADTLTWGSLTGGWTTRGSDDDLASTVGTGHVVSFADLIQASAAATGNVANTLSSANTANRFIVTFAETVVSPPTFDSGPTVTAVDNNTFRVTYDASADADAIFCMAKPLDESAPAASAIEAGTDAHGTGTEATTGSSDTLDFDVTDSPAFPAYDVYCALEEGTSNYSSVGTQADEFLTAPTGFQYSARLTSIGTGSGCELFNDATLVTLGYDAQTANFTVGSVLVGATSGAYADIELDTDGGTSGTLTLYVRSGTFQDDENITDQHGGAAVANGTASAVADIATTDIVTVPTTVSPEGAALTIGADCGTAYTADGRQVALDGDIYDASATARFAIDFDLVFNNGPPSCPGELSAVVRKIDEAMATVALSAQCSDPEDDTLTYSLVAGAVPGVSVNYSTGDIDGTPTVEDEAGIELTYLVRDIYGGDTTRSVLFYPIESWTLGDYVGETLTQTLIDIAALTRESVTEFSITTQRSCDVDASIVLEQDPAAMAEIAPFDTFSLVVSSGCPSGGGGKGIRLPGVGMSGL